MDPSMNNANFALDVHHSPVNPETTGLIPGVPSTQHNRRVWWGNLLGVLSDNHDQA